MKLRTGGYSKGARPIKNVFDRFWKSSKDHSKFNAEVSHNPEAEWNELFDIFG